MHYDCVIVGGGIVGASMAIMLGQMHYRVLLLEKQSVLAQPEPMDARTIALSYASFCIYSALGLWQPVADKAVPIEQVWVSMQGQYGGSHLDCQQEGLPALGFVVGAQHLEEVLYGALASLETVTVLRPATLLSQQGYPDNWHLLVQAQDATQAVTCRLLVAADGVQSILRESQGIPWVKKDYGHYAIMTNVRWHAATKGVAIERFLPQGAIALLPWQNDWATCIWTLAQVQAKTLSALPADEFLAACQRALGGRMGQLLQVGKRHCFPLQMQFATTQITSRFMLAGNAAHSLHPIAAQGLNLSLRDIWQLRGQLLKARATPCDIGSPVFLAEYYARRKADQTRMIFATDWIARFMASGTLPGALRAMGMTLFDSFTPCKRLFTQAGMGML